MSIPKLSQLTEEQLQNAIVDIASREYKLIIASQTTKEHLAILCRNKGVDFIHRALSQLSNFEELPEGFLRTNGDSVKRAAMETNNNISQSKVAAQAQPVAKPDATRQSAPGFQSFQKPVLQQKKRKVQEDYSAASTYDTVVAAPPLDSFESTDSNQLKTKLNDIYQQNFTTAESWNAHFLHYSDLTVSKVNPETKVALQPSFDFAKAVLKDRAHIEYMQNNPAVIGQSNFQNFISSDFLPAFKNYQAIFNDYKNYAKQYEIPVESPANSPSNSPIIIND